MIRLMKDDKVRIKRDGRWRFGIVEQINKTTALVQLDDYYKAEKFFITELEYLPPVSVKQNEYKKMVRFEKTVFDFVGEDGFYRCIQNEEGYELTVLDILEALKNIKNNKMTVQEIYNKWYCYMENVLKDFVCEDETGFYNTTDLMENISERLYYWITYENEINIGDLISEVQIFLEDKNKPLLNRRYPEYIKNKIVNDFQNEVLLNNASDEEVALFKMFAIELCEKKQKNGLLAVGYGCYGGNRAFACDWEKSKDCMESLVDMDDSMPDKAFYANTLGYIYYYGRCNNGIPQYEQAYKYFSFAAFNEVYEATYKIADMYKNGYGVIKSAETSNTIIRSLYNDNIKYMVKGEFQCKFADIALRMGNIYKNEEDIYESDFDEMLYYYTQADYAIRMRMKEDNYYGDTKVCAAIQKELAQTKEMMGFVPQSKITYYSLYWIFENFFSVGNKLELTIEELKNNSYKMTFRPHNKNAKIFITIPQIEVCGMYEKFDVILKTDQRIDNELIGNTVLLDGMEYHALLYDEKCILDCEDFEFEISAPDKKAEKTYRIASVCFSSGGKLYDYLCDDRTVKEKDSVRVSVNGEEKEVLVIKIDRKKESELALPINRYKKIYK